MDPEPRRISLVDILTAPLGCLSSISPAVVITAFLGLFGIGLYLYYFTNINLFGIGAPQYNQYQISPSFDRIKGPENSFTIEYETPYDRTFSGLVRHASQFRVDDVPFYTHDILVTSGDYADPQLVSVAVIDHKFIWKASAQPKNGSINLLHTVALNKEIYQKLMKIRPGDRVKILGREIYKINIISSSGQLVGYWQDHGCNSLLVKSVVIEH
jgi:hypothetical protein